MMKSWVLVLAVAGSVAAAGHAMAQAAVNQPAPMFKAQATDGTTINLSGFKGRFVVLEWMNPDCPFTLKHYDSGNMPAVQKEAVAKGVVWLSIASTAKNTEGYRSAGELDAWLKSKAAAPTAAVMDGDSKVARAYGARTTPHMYVINPQGTLIYAGAIDSKASANPADIPAATNYVSKALDEALAGRPVTKAVTKSYGCGIKYAD